MLRFYYVILISIPLIIYYLLMCQYYYKHEEKYDEEDCYRLARKLIYHLKKKAGIKTVSYGYQNLPEEGGYIMYSNHQGKYDAVGIISAHDRPCSVIMDAQKSKVILTNQFMDLIRGVRLDRRNFKQQLKASKDITEGAVQGKKYIYFPEGKYERNGNHLQDFRPGSFKCAKMARCPIVPVAICDSYLPFDFNSLRKVVTQVYFLPPIYYEEYKGKTTKEISLLVKKQIEDKLLVLDKIRDEKGYNRSFRKIIRY